MTRASYAARVKARRYREARDFIVMVALDVIKLVVIVTCLPAIVTTLYLVFN